GRRWTGWSDSRAGRSPAGSRAPGARTGPGGASAAIRRARAWMSPEAERTSAKPAARAASAVASPTAKTGWLRKRGISGAKASTRCGRVGPGRAPAAGPGGGSGGPGRGASGGRGTTSGVKPRAVRRSAVRAAPGSARVTQTRRIGVITLKRDLLVAGDGLNLAAEVDAEGAGGGVIEVGGDIARAGPAARTVRAEHFGAEVQAAVCNVGVGADGGAAGAFQRGHGPALGGDSEGGGGVVEGAGPGGVDVALARLQGQCALARRG